MYSNYRIPQNDINMYQNNENYQNFQSDDRFIASTVLAPFLLGGIAGYIVGGQNNNQGNFYPTFYPYPFPINYQNNNFGYFW